MLANTDQGIDNGFIYWDFPLLSILCILKMDDPPLKINVPPFKLHDLPFSHAGIKGDNDNGFNGRNAVREQSGDFLFFEEPDPAVILFK